MCVDQQADVEHCGRCGNVCGNGEVCNRGTCQVLPTDCTMGAGCGPGYSCDPVTRRCMAGCRLSTDCPMGATCSMGQCRCPTGQHACGQQCVSDTAVSSCGSSCGACPTTMNGSATCGAGVCGLTCASGYVRNGNTCVDINECLTNNGGCSANAACTNTPGSRTCACNAGFTGDGLTCADVNECLTNNGGCDLNAMCSNTPGARACSCNSGYSGNGLTCTDVNECLTNNGNCSANAMCTNTVGARTCACNGGYQGDGVSCADINECLTNNGGCASAGAGGVCTNLQGTRMCSCATGFTGDGLTCADVDECLTNNGGCASVALGGVCSNTQGSRTCACAMGYSGSGFTCADVNECFTNNGGCASVASGGACQNTTGSRTCSCVAGYTGNGLTCADVNECLTSNGGCSSNATCTNTTGSRTCACNSGYLGNGVTCTVRPGGETCEVATVVTSGQTVVSSFVGAVSNYSGYGGNLACEVNGIRDLVFQASIAPGQRGRFVAAGASNPDLDVVVGPASTCNLNPRVCMMGTTGPGSVGSFMNGTASPVSAFAIVGPSAGDDFTLSYQATTPVANDVCSTATTTLVTGTLTSQSFAGFEHDYECYFLSGVAGPDRVYRVPLAANTKLVVTATPTASLSMYLDIIDGPASACDAPTRTCLDSSRTANAGQVRTARFSNLGSTPREVFVVAGQHGAGTGTFSLTSAITPIITDDICSTATTVLAAGSPLTNQALSGFAADYTCRSGVTSDRVYLAQVPALSQLVVVMTPPAGMDAALVGINGPAGTCDSPTRVCLPSAEAGGAGVVETLRLSNNSMTPRDFFVVAGAITGATAGPFTIAATVEPLPPGETCDTATTLTAGTLPSEVMAGFASNYSISNNTRPTCRTTFNAPDRAYQVVVPAGQLLTVTATSASDLILNLIPEPASSCGNVSVACLASADATLSGASETISWRNATANPATVYLLVTGLGSMSAAPVSITTTIQP